MKPSIIIFLATIFVISSVSFARRSAEEACIRRNIARSQSPVLPPKSRDEPRKLDNDYLETVICSDVGRALMFYVRLNGKLPSHYFKALCNVFGNNEEKVKDYVTKNWLDNGKLIEGYSCASV